MKAETLSIIHLFQEQLGKWKHFSEHDTQLPIALLSMGPSYPPIEHNASLELHS